jgi:hypothetical protein
LERGSIDAQDAKFAIFAHLPCSDPVMVTVAEPLVAGVVPLPLSISEVILNRSS